MKTSFLVKSFGISAIVFFSSISTNGQCPGAGTTQFGDITITSDCTVSGDLTLQGPTLTVDPGVTFTVTGNLTIQGDAEVTGSSNSMINIGGDLIDAWTGGGANTISDAIFTITGDILETSGGVFNIDNAVVTAATMETSGGSTLNVINGSDVTIAGAVSSEEAFNVNNSVMDIGGTLEVTGGDNVTISNNGELIIRGDYDLNGSGGGGIVMTVETGGVVRIFGDVNSSTGGNTIDVDDNSGISVDGDFVGGTPPGVTVGTGGGSGCTVGGGCCGSAVACGTATTLPVSLISYSYVLVGDVVTLNWSTASEFDNDFYTVERSFDGVNFNELCTLRGAGTSNETSTYNHSDRIPFSSVNQVYYRLSQTDFDGTHEVLGVLAVSVTSIDLQLKIVPNPVISSSFELLGAPLNAEWSIYSLSGNKVLSGSLDVDNTIDVSDLTEGTYLLRMDDAQSGSSTLIVR